MNFKSIPLAVVILMALAPLGARAAVTAEEAKKLGTVLTPFGAEVAGNKDGSIPAYTGGLPVTTSPPGFIKDSGRWADPFAHEKPLYSITAQNMAQYADKLTEANKALLQRHASYRIDVYPTHRTAAFPQYVLDNSIKNATAAKLIKDGLAVENAYGGIAFPIPRNGNEVMWNHITRFRSFALDYNIENWYVDSTGRPVLAGKFNCVLTMPYYNPGGDAKTLKESGNHYYRGILKFIGPPRNVGDVTVIADTLDPDAAPRRAYSYSASTRRTRLAPDVAYDTPIGSQAGATTYDDQELFSGKMDRFDFKLIGKKEMIIPYSNYKFLFGTTPKDALGPKHINPDVMRWELHRVWVVEATLKPGARHLYSKRVFYFDEDMTGAGMSDEYDAAGRLYKGLLSQTAQLYDVKQVATVSYSAYDLATGAYSMGVVPSPGPAFVYRAEPVPATFFMPEALPRFSGR